jgi:hypothetical protein
MAALAYDHDTIDIGFGEISTLGSMSARAAIARLREIDSALRLSNIDRMAPPLRRPEDRARFIEGLRKAGLPE